MTDASGRSARGLRGRFLLLGGSLLFCAALALGTELALRLIRPGRLETAPALQPHVYSPVYGWRLRPSWHGRTRDGRTVRLNHAGFRGAAAGEGAPGRRRVLLLGDSLTFGTGVEDSETFAAQLAQLAPALEPLNLGVSGYGTDQELLLLEREGLPMAPAVIVLDVCVGNDVLDNALPVYVYDGVTPKPYFTASGETLRLHDEHVRLHGMALLARRLRERSLAFDALLSLAGGTQRAPLDHDDGEHWGPRARLVLEHWPAAVELTQRLLARMDEVCAARGARLLVLLHPNRRAYLGDATFLEPFAAAAPRLRPATRMIDLRSTYLEQGLAWEDFTLDKLGHLNPRGHRLVAEVLAKELGG